MPTLFFVLECNRLRYAVGELSAAAARRRSQEQADRGKAREVEPAANDLGGVHSAAQEQEAVMIENGVASSSSQSS
jgi:hypothetical protein